MNEHRSLCIKKDLIELQQWITALEIFNKEIDYLILIEKQILVNPAIANSIQRFRRENTLTMGSLCKYEQQLKQELEYGKSNYDVVRAKEHERIRGSFINLNNEFIKLKEEFYKKLCRYKIGSA